MHILELLLTATGLAMDAFAVSICLGLSIGAVTFKKALTVGLYFGIFQFAMPLLGYLIGSQFAGYIEAYDHWVAFILLAIIGGKMVKESFDKDCPNANMQEDLRPKKMLLLSIATSIDALAVGVSFAFLNVHILPAAGMIGFITLGLSMAGVKIGNVFGMKYKARAELIGGSILILIGLKILLEHMGVINF